MGIWRREEEEVGKVPSLLRPSTVVFYYRTVPTLFILFHQVVPIGMEETGGPRRKARRLMGGRSDKYYDRHDARSLSGQVYAPEWNDTTARLVLEGIKDFAATVEESQNVCTRSVLEDVDQPDVFLATYCDALGKADRELAEAS